MNNSPSREIGRRIKELRKVEALTQEDFALRIKRDKSTVSKLESGEMELSSYIRLAICNVFAVNERWLLYGEGNMYDDKWALLRLRAKELGEDIYKKLLIMEGTKKRYEEITDQLPRVSEDSPLYNEEVKKVDVFSLAGAGEPKLLTEYEPIDTIYIPIEFTGPSITPVKVRGDSMHPLIRNGAFVGIDNSEREVVSGEIYAVWIPYEGAIIKRLFMSLDRVEVKSDNPIFPAYSLLYKELDENFILGRVKWVIQKL